MRFKKEKRQKAEDRARGERPVRFLKKYRPANTKTVHEGTIRVSSRGVGYVEVEGLKEDIEIDPRFLGTALDLDRVRIQLHGKKVGTRQTGEIVKILFRNKVRFVGVLIKEGGSLFLEPDDPRMYRRILIPKQHAATADKGEKVAVEIYSWTNSDQDPLGKVVDVIGKPDTHETEMRSIIIERGFDITFDPDVLEAAESIPDHIGEIDTQSRRDFRGIDTYTIDPVDAKDFDDALSFQKIGDALYEVGVHIADVSHYVPQGSRIDKEACERGTSVYLVDRTIPMLPERLSNGICSLVPNEDRLAFSAVFEITENGDVKKEWFGKTIIHSNFRHTYESAQDIIGGKDHASGAAICTLDRIAKKLRERRIKEGAIAFEAEEVKFELDQNGKPIRVFKKVIRDSNKLIEEFMLLANTRVAKLIASKDKRAESVFVYRVHDEPDPERIENLRDYLRGIGFTLGKGKKNKITSGDINRMLEEVRGHAEESMIQIATVRSMARATYSTKNIGHYGLAFGHYTHFTSPIRRYPDLMVHRLLANYLEGRPIPKKRLEEHEHIARYATQMEIAASDAERASIKYKQCEFFSERIGYEFTGAITGVTEWGIYVEEPETKSEGMVHVRNMKSDFYIFEEKNYRLIGKSRGTSYKLGTKVRAKVVSVDMKKKQISLALI